MADYDSDSSAGDDLDIQTNVLLGYSSREPTGDDFSQLGGRPIWFVNDRSEPSGALGKCKVCNGVLSLLLQLNANLPDRFPGHERRLYVFGCRRKACRRKEGSVRAMRAVRGSAGASSTVKDGESEENVKTMERSKNLGETLFGVKAPTPAQANPFASTSSAASSMNPFSSKTTSQAPSLQPAATATNLPATFAQKASISTPSESPATPAAPPEPWPSDPSPFPAYYVDADKEYLEPEPETVPSNARVDTEGGGGSAADEKAAFESAMDKTFQQFADRLAQNPEQILRYEFSGLPLLYSKSDAVGKLLSPSGSHTPRIPRCPSCGAARTFEMQLAPHAITELEAEETSIDGMEWGTVIVAVCSEDCTGKGKGDGEVSYLEEWAGVQWEEVADGKGR